MCMHVYMHAVGFSKYIFSGKGKIIITLRWQGSLSVEVNENMNLGYGQDQGYS